MNEGVSSLKCIVVYEVCSVFLLNGDRIRLTHSVCDHLRETPILHPGIVRVDGLPVQLPDALLDREKVCVSCGPWSLSGTRGIDSGLDLCERAESFILVQAADLSDRTLSIAPGSRKRVALALDLSRLAHSLWPTPATASVRGPCCNHVFIYAALAVYSLVRILLNLKLTSRFTLSLWSTRGPSSEGQHSVLRGASCLTSPLQVDADGQ